MQRISQLNPSLLTAIQQDSELMEEIAGLAKSDAMYAGLESVPADPAAVRPLLERFSEEGVMAEDSDAAAIAEAIILRHGRPSFLIRNGIHEVPNDQRVWNNRLQPGREAILTAIRAVGRVELRGHPSFPWVGTGWLVAPDVIVTNRHVANEFAVRGSRGFVFRPGLGGEPMRANLDFLEEFGLPREQSIDVERVLFIAGAGSTQPDLAFLQLQRAVDAPPIRLAQRSQPAGRYVAVIGYPARDDRRNDPDAAREIFKDIYEKKRLAPGQLRAEGDGHPLHLQHDCTTLGGNSGSVVLDALSGEAIGLHFGGRFEVANFAVRAEVVRSFLENLSRSRNMVSAEAAPGSPDDYADRAGYQPDFLGASDDQFVPLPTVTGRRQSDVQRQTRGPQRGCPELRYTHFSVVMSKSRRLPFFTAVNIDGNRLVRPRRGRDVWRFDPRLPEAAQLGNDVYADNKLDRGHLVRRLDPVWGAGDEAKLAEEDTFHYTNAAPQHLRLNRSNSQWVGLEDYILDNADVRDLKVTVFAGPMFSDRDLRYRDVLIPEEFWKVAVNVRSDSRLSATAYLLSQGQFLDDIEFAFGPFRTFQVPIRTLESRTGLSFNGLNEFDPLERVEGLGAFVVIDDLQQIVL